MTLNRWPASHAPRAPQRVHAIPAADSRRIIRPSPAVLRPRSVHPVATPLRAIDMAPVLLRAERDAPKNAGFTITGITVKCAPAPESVVAPRDHAWLRVGMRVRHISGPEGAVVALELHSTPSSVVVAYDKGMLAGNTCGALASNLEPAPSPAPVEASDPITECERLGMAFEQDGFEPGETFHGCWRVVQPNRQPYEAALVQITGDEIRDKREAAKLALQRFRAESCARVALAAHARAVKP